MNEIMFFMTRSIWYELGIPMEQRRETFVSAFGEKTEINNKEQAIPLVEKAVEASASKILDLFQKQNSSLVLIDLLNIQNEIMELYLAEKKSRIKMAEENVRDENLTDAVSNNRNIERHIIDACNIWIENWVLYQNDSTTPIYPMNSLPQINKALLLELFVYGCASQALTLLRLSKELDEGNFYGVEIDPEAEIPLNVLREHPVIYFNPVISGNQSILSRIADSTIPIDQMKVAEGFEKEYHIPFSTFLGVLLYFQKTMLKNDCRRVGAMPKKEFLHELDCLDPPINGEQFLEYASVNKRKMQMQLKSDEKTIWKVGVNKYRLEIRPVIEKEDGQVVISYGACRQAMELWHSNCMNGGNCYTIKGLRDNLQNGMEARNKELSDILVNKICEILRKNYTALIDLTNVDYKRIFGSRDRDYGDYDIVFFTGDELFLAEAKYFSDSLTVSGLVNDYEKLFKTNGYYDHCRARYDLVMDNPELMKQFVGVDPTNKIKVYFLFISSKPIEMQLQDKDGVVTFLSLGILEDFIKGKLLSQDGGSMIKPALEM